MFVLWAVYLTCNIIFFEEPDRGESTTKNAPSKSSEQIEENSPIPSSSTGGTHPSENTPLIKPPHISISFDALSQKKESRCNIPVLVSMLLLVLLKSVLESLTSSAPTISGFYFGWGVHDSGIYLAGLASFMLPCSFAVAQISRKYDDRELILATLLMMLIGILGFLVYGGDEDSYSETRFILFGFVIFVSCNALEGPTMGLLSKTIPQSLAKGILNAGLLATEAGTVGRVIGDFWLSTAAYMGLDKVVNNTFLPLGVVVFVSILIAVQAFSHLQPRYEDEDDDD